MPSQLAPPQVWPRPKGFKHFVLLGVPPTASLEVDKLARDLVAGDAKNIFGDEGKYEICPSSLENYHSVEDVSCLHVLVWGSAANCYRFTPRTTKNCRNWNTNMILRTG